MFRQSPAQFISILYSQNPRCYIKTHHHSLRIRLIRTVFRPQGFFPWPTTLWNSLRRGCFSEPYNLHLLKSRLKHHILVIFISYLRSYHTLHSANPPTLSGSWVFYRVNFRQTNMLSLSFYLSTLYGHKLIHLLMSSSASGFAPLMLEPWRSWWASQSEITSIVRKNHLFLAGASPVPPCQSPLVKIFCRVLHDQSQQNAPNIYLLAVLWEQRQASDKRRW